MRLFIFLVALFVAGSTCYTGAQTSHAEPQEKGTVTGQNRLGFEKSPYLLQHKDNPVNWFPWGSEAFLAAKREDKPIFLSIGYSTCYWCHVMEKDSFERKDVADVLNKNFISIKVDREERPDVDSIYMDSVVAISGHGGWPMSVFLTPDRKPFFGGTFFYREQFLSLLSQIATAWRENQLDLKQSAEKLTEFIQRKVTEENDSSNLDSNAFIATYQHLTSRFDSHYGGFSTAPKFPPAQPVRLLLRIHRRTEEPQALSMATKTLTAMARSGLYDQLGGGFHRYATDEKWLVPHFEKMLYDNALLSLAYLEAFQVTKDESYSEVARATLNYVLREMTDDAGGFYSAQDAGEVGKEGEYYVWTEAELKALLSESELTLIRAIYGVSTTGNFEHQSNIFHLPPQVAWEDKKKLAAVHEKLMAARAKRSAPHLDDKVLTGWNGLMIAGMSLGYQTLGEKRFLDAAQKNAHFLRNNCYKSGQLFRRYRDGDAAFDATLEDYAYLTHGLLALYQSDFDNQWLDWAEELIALQDKIFADPNGGFFYASGADQTLIIRKKEFEDGAIPAANGIAALNLFELHSLTGKAEYRKSALRIVELSLNEMKRYPSLYATALIALDYHLDSAKELAIIGDKNSPSAQSMLKAVRAQFLPNKVIVLGSGTPVDDLKSIPLLRGKVEMNGQTTFYVCEEQSCKRPTNSAEEALSLMNKRKSYALK